MFDFTNTPVNSALNLKAKWEIKSYTVTFDTDGGSTIASVPVNHGAKVTAPAVPTKEGFTFDGWFLNEVAYDFNSAVTGDLTLKAKWVEEVEEKAFNTHITFAALTGKGTTTLSQTTMLAALKAGEQKENPADPSSIVSVSSVSTVYDGNASGGTFPSTAGLLKFGSGNNPGSFTFTISRKVHTVKVLAAGWASGEGQISVNDSTSQAVVTTKTWLEFSLEKPTDTITISSVVKRVFVFEIELIGGPVIPDPELDNIIVSSASGVASVEEKQTLQLSAVVYDVDGALVDNANVTWESLNEEIAEISGTGLVTAVAPGNVMIKVVAVRGSSEKEVQYALEVTARPAAAPNKVVFVGYSSVSNPSKTVALSIGTFVLEATVYDQYEQEVTGIELVWESSNTTVATVAVGTVTLLTEGSTTIKVSLSGDAAVYSEFALSVETQAPVTEKEVTLSYASGSGTGNMTGANQAALLGLDDQIFDVKGIKGSPDNNIGLNNAGHLRLYTKNNTGNTLTVSISSSRKISKIVLNFGTTVAQAKVLVDSVEKYNNTPTKSTSLTLENLSASAFSIQNVNSGTTQLYINSIVITYID